MAGKPPDILEVLSGQVFENAKNIDTDWRTTFVLHLATLTLLIDAKLCTIEEAARRVEHIQRVLPEQFHSPDVDQRLGVITDWLRQNENAPKPGWTPEVIEGGQSRDPETD